MSVAQWVEVHRLAVDGPEVGIAREVGDKVGRVWLAWSRFADVVGLTELTLTLGEDPAALYHLGSAKHVTGFPAEALAAFDRVLSLCRNGHDRPNEAATLNNIGGVHDNLGDRQQALDYYGQALSILREVGNRAGEAITLSNIGMTHSGLGDRQRALDYYEHALPIQREVGDRAGEAATLNNIGSAHNGLGDRQRALNYSGKPYPSTGKSATAPAKPPP